MGNNGSKEKNVKNAKHHAKVMSNPAPRLAKSDASNTSDTQVWIKRNENTEKYNEFEILVVQETVLDKGFDKRSCLPPLPPIPQSDSLFNVGYYDMINDDLVGGTNPQEICLSAPITDERCTHLPQQQTSLDTVPKQRTTRSQPKLDVTRTTPSCSKEQTSHDVSQCLGYEEMVEIFQPLIVKNLIVREILPHLPFIEDHENLYIADRRSPREAVCCLLNELKSCKEIGKWHKFLEALRLCGYEYIVQNINGYRFVNHHYQEEYLKKLAPKLSKMIRARELLPHVYAKGIISQNDREEIEREDTNFGNIAAATMLLNRIPRKRTKWYTKFIAILRDEGLSDVADDLDIPNLTISEKIKVQQPLMMSADIGAAKTGKSLGTLESNHTLGLGWNKEVALTPQRRGRYDDDSMLDLSDLDEMVTAPHVPPRGVPLLNSKLSYLFNTKSTADWKDHGERGNCKSSNKSHYSDSWCYATDEQIRPSHTTETDDCYDLYDYHNVRSTSDSDLSDPKELGQLAQGNPANDAYKDEFYRYENYDDCQYDDCLSIEWHCGKNAEKKENKDDETNDKFQSLKKEVSDLQSEAIDLDEEIKYLQKKCDMRGSVNVKLRQKRELLRSIHIKEKEEAALKASLDSPPKDGNNDYECPESARMFWKNRSGLLRVNEKTTIHFKNNNPMESATISSDPVKLYDAKSFDGYRTFKWSYNDSAIDCVY